MHGGSPPQVSGGAVFLLDYSVEVHLLVAAVWCFGSLFRADEVSAC